MARRSRCSGVPEIDEYVNLVETGKIVACEDQKKLCAYVRRVFKAEKLTVDRERLDGYLKYQTFFFPLDPWEKFLLALGMCTFRDDGLPRWLQMFVYVGRGAGKTGFGAYVSFCSASAVNGIAHYDVDICANSEDQAKRMFMDVHGVLEDGDQRTFRKAWYWNLEMIQNKGTKSEIRFRTNNTKTKDGLRSGEVVFDEVHAFQNWDNIKVFTTGLGKKPHPRRWYFTTDGDVREGVLDRLKERAERILSGEEDDNGFFPFICRLDAVDEFRDKANWAKANPHLPYSPTLMAEMEAELADYMLDPINNSAFMTKRMNIPQGDADAEVATWDDIVATNRPLPDLCGMPCVIGIDFAKTTDFIGAVALFREDETYYVLHHSWLCSRSKDRQRIKAPLNEWTARGLLTVVDDVEVHPSYVVDWIADVADDYVVEKIAIDSYRHSFFMRELASAGWTAKDGNVKLIRPSDVMLAQPKINSAFVNHTLVWGDDPMMRWYTNNTKLEPAAHGNYTYGKIEPKSRKTDGFMALVAAMAVEEFIPEVIDFEFFDPVSL